MRTRGPNGATSSRRKPDPTPPENVRIVLSDGTVIPCELRYLGRVDGLDAWETVLRVAIPEGMGAELCADTLPAMSSITIDTTQRSMP